jgi:hypothetical protein
MVSKASHVAGSSWTPPDLVAEVPEHYAADRLGDGPYSNAPKAAMVAASSEKSGKKILLKTIAEAVL